MTNPEQLSLEDENQQLRAAIAELEERLRRRENEEPPAKRAEAALDDSFLQYKEIFDNTTVCLFMIDVTADGRFKLAAINGAEERVVGLANDQVAGRFIDELFDQELAGHVSANYRRCLEAGRAIDFDDQLDLPGGEYWHTNLIPLRNAGGVISRIIGSCVNITDLKRTQEEALAKQNLESLGVLAGGIAHDFNNLLGGIYAQAELAEIDLGVGSEACEKIQMIKDSAIRGSEIVRELMVYAGKDEQNSIEALDLSRLVEHMLELLKVSISKHAVLKTDLGKGLPFVPGNASRMRQVVMNLVINASEAIGEKDGVITVTTAHEKDNDGSGGSPQASVFDQQGNYVALEVTDTGSGMTEATKTRIFDPFFSTKFAGRGMGLAVVSSIVRDHSGSIQVASTAGVGTTFRVLLPCVEKGPAEGRHAIPSVQLPQGRARTGVILVVEDEELLRTAISTALRKAGCPVIEAEDGSSAMELLRAHKDDLDAVLLDVTLPGTSSREVFEEARRMRDDLRVVVTSAYSRESVGPSFGGLPGHQFIRKPFPLGDVVRLLRDGVSS
jgi:two-component system, cell cycle sensor histidine kinase and response regulator CckA